jgi:predicted O-linked N-acetylglucosamine transferase (SPINDLY family)
MFAISGHRPGRIRGLNRRVTEADAAVLEARALQQQGRLAEADALCRRALTLAPEHFEALTLAGILAARLGDARRAESCFRQALLRYPERASAHANHGNSLAALGEHAQALACYERALKLDPRDALAHNQRGNALFALRRYHEALGSYEAALALAPRSAGAHFNRGNALLQLRQYRSAVASFDATLALNARHAGAHNNRGSALRAQGAYAEALDSYEAALVLQPNYAEAHGNRGNALRELGRHEEAARSYERALTLNPKLPLIESARLYACMHLCDWQDFAIARERLAQRIENGEPAAEPFMTLALFDSRRLQQQAALLWTQSESPADAALGPCTHPAHERIRIGYFSADFRNHPLAALTAELFELHDRSCFEVTAFSFGPATDDAMQRRLAQAFEHFVQVGELSDRELTQHARERQIDIAVDLNGFTAQGRPRVFALRAAPVQVSWLGFLGTLGAEWMDYLIADRVLVPESERASYTERLLYLESYQPNDSLREIAARAFTRAELGLPPEGFVFCCFNSAYKISPETFATWMRVLQAVPQSVLLLVRDNPAMERNLRREAQRLGVNAQRLVFCERIPFPEYLARLRVADLFLDTLPYNAGTTASDALWVGLPVLTCRGTTFAGRVAASLLEALGLPELIAENPADFERRAARLAHVPRQLAEVRTRVAAQRLTARLFDTPRFARSLEAAYQDIYQRYRTGLRPGPERRDGVTD